MPARSRTEFLVKQEAGYRLTVRPLLAGHRLEEFPLDGGMGRFWCYRTGAAAILAGQAWSVDTATEPVGWFARGGARQPKN